MNARGQYGNAAYESVPHRGSHGRTYASGPVSEPRSGARRRAVRAVFDMYTRRGGQAPYYVYAEVNGSVDQQAVRSLDEANAIFFALSRAPGEVYVSIFTPTDPNWPNPSLDVYRAAPVERALVGQGSYLGHTPTEVETELDQLHGEIMAYGQQLIALVDRDEAQRLQKSSDTDLRKIEEEYQALRKVEERFLPLVREVDRIKEQLVSSPTSSALLLELRDAQLRLNKVILPEKRTEIVRRLRVLADKRAEAQGRILSKGASDLERWDQDVWKPFFSSWQKFREIKKKPAQTWPLTGTWDHIQDYRQQFVDLWDRSPFKPSGPRPLSPSGRKDPSLFGDARSILKWGLIGALGIGGVVAISVIASNIKKDRGA